MTGLFKCDVCGELFDTPEQANECELKHEEIRLRREKEKEERELKRKEKKAREAEINELIKKYMEDFHEFPHIVAYSDNLGTKMLFRELFR